MMSKQSVSVRGGHRIKHAARPASASRVIGGRRCRILTLCQSTSTSVQVKELAKEVLVPAADLRSSVELRLVNEGKGQAIEIEYVSEGSAARAIGLKPGQKLRSIEDPIRSEQMYDLGNNPSLKFVLDAIMMSRHAEIKLKVEDPIKFQDAAAGPSTFAAVADPPAAPAAAVSSSLSSTDRSLSVIEALDTLTGNGSSLTIAQQLQQQLAELQAAGSAPPEEDGIILLRLGAPQAEAAPQQDASVLNSLFAAQSADTEGIQPTNDVQARIKRRKDYLDQVSQRNDTAFFSGLFGAFLLPPAIILGLAYASGYMDTLFANTLH